MEPSSNLYTEKLNRWIRDNSISFKITLCYFLPTEKDRYGQKTSKLSKCKTSIKKNVLLEKLLVTLIFDFLSPRLQNYHLKAFRATKMFIKVFSINTCLEVFFKQNLLNYHEKRPSLIPKFSSIFVYFTSWGI